MIILDTNVVSEAMKLQGEPAVKAWLDLQEAETLYLTAVNVAELLTGVELLPEGRRKSDLSRLLSDLLQRLFEARILPFDLDSARCYAHAIRRARAAGRNLSVADGQIAAIAMARGFTVATRDSSPFAAAGVPVINPWEIAG